MCVVNAASLSDPCVDGPGLVPFVLSSSISLSTDVPNLDSADMCIGFANSACSWSLAGEAPDLHEVLADVRWQLPAVGSRQGPCYTALAGAPPQDQVSTDVRGSGLPEEGPRKKQK